jgi:hypothetical protein
MFGLIRAWSGLRCNENATGVTNRTVVSVEYTSNSTLSSNSQDQECSVKLLRNSILLHVGLGLLLTGVSIAQTPSPANARPAASAARALPQLTAAEVVAKNLTARGGAAAWRSVETLSTSGKMDLPGKADLEAPFLLEQKRGRKSRLEIKFQGKTSIQVYDGTAGWKLRPFLGRKEVEQYSPLELKTASKLPDLDGPLMNAE